MTRQTSISYYQQEKELQKQHLALKEEEKRIFKKRRDDYLELHQKSLLPEWNFVHKRGATEAETATLTQESIVKMNNKELKRVFKQIGLICSYKGDSTAQGQKRCLWEYITDPQAYKHYETKRQKK